MIQLRFKPAERLLIFLMSLAICALIGSVMAGIVLHGGISTKSLRVATVIQDCMIFILPAVMTAVVIAPLPARFLKIDNGVEIRQLFLAILAMVVSIPAINWLVALNENISLPESMSRIEAWMRFHEEEARSSVKLLLGNDGSGALVIDLLIVGLLAGFSEEFLFRGAIQQLFSTSKINIHLSIWLTAFIFSAIHLQFFGFFPRLLLGAYFGYLFYWSRSLWLPVIIHALNNSIVVYATWDNNHINGSSEPSLNSWGVESPELVIASVILTTIVIRSLNRHCRSKNSTATVNNI